MKRNHSINTINKFFEIAAKFKYFRGTITKKFMQKDGKIRLNSGNAC